MMMDFTVRKLTPNAGVEISGLDLRQPLDPDTMAEVRKVWLDNVVVVFPEQPIDDEQQIAFSRQVGKLELINMSALQMPGKPEIYRATNLDENDEFLPPDHPVMQVNHDNRKWHSDSSFKLVPAMASLLHARIVPPVGGDTAFANMAAAYEALSDDMKAKLEGLVAVHNFYWSRRDVQVTAFTQEETNALPPTRHPVVRRHPETGRRALYVGSHTESIEGMEWDEGRALIDSLIEHATQREFVYQHAWGVGDLVWWDNRAALHCGTPFDITRHKRRLHRTTVAGTGPTL
jgi:alpha-ketoglutarate-dependent 2,4-dichlorophenoxyacetate dioxygenase